MTKIAVLGGGNGAHAAAADLALRGFEVNMYEDERFASNMQQVFETKKIELSGAAGSGTAELAAAADLALRGFEVNMYEDERFASNMQQVFETKKIELSGAAGSGTAELAMVTSDLATAIEGVKVILVAVPAFAHAAYAEKLAEVVTAGQIVVVLPGTFGSLMFWKEFKARGVEDVCVAESHTLPYATRLLGPGASLVMSRFDPLKVGVMPASRTDEVIAALDGVFPGIEAVESVVACGLSSLNPIIHVPGCILNAGSRRAASRMSAWPRATPCRMPPVCSGRARRSS